MIIALDTNVISEVTKPHPDPNVMDWVFRQTHTSLAMPSVVAAELYRGINLLPRSNRRRMIEAAVQEAIFGLRILDFDENAAKEYGLLASMKGRPVPTMDVHIAATCLSHGASLATRNITDFPIDLIDPWEPALF